MKETELRPYLAGVIDTSGYISARRRKKGSRSWIQYSIRIYPGPRAAEIISEVYGGKIESEHGRIGIYSKEGVSRMISDTLPYLVDQKERARIICEFMNSGDTDIDNLKKVGYT